MDEHPEDCCCVECNHPYGEHPNGCCCDDCVAWIDQELEWEWQGERRAEQLEAMI
jgi:hypothetical protein